MQRSLDERKNQRGKAKQTGEQEKEAAPISQVIWMRADQNSLELHLP